MVGYIHGEFLKILDTVEWMDDETRQKAKDKAYAIKPYIGYPDELLDNEKITELYKDVKSLSQHKECRNKTFHVSFNCSLSCFKTSILRMCKIFAAGPLIMLLVNCENQI